MSLLPLPPIDAAAGEFLHDVWRGLSARPRRLPCKWLYDGRGSALFDEICTLEEYYPTRCELAVLREHAGEMAGLIGPDAAVVEYGSGSGLKTRLLLDALRSPAAYVPVDISRGHLLRAAAGLRRERPGLAVVPVAADFTRPFAVPRLPAPPRRRVVYFAGSTIGNFAPRDARRLLAGIARLVGPGGGLLIGVDLRKGRDVLERAYDDARGVTAAFNLNLLGRINRELGGTFDLTGFRHEAVYDEARGRVEMWLVSRREQVAQVAGRQFRFADGDRVCTEHSYKYTLPGFARLAARAGLQVCRVWTDREGLFSVQYAEAGASPLPG